MINEFSWYLKQKSRRLLHFVQQTGIVRFLLPWATWRQNFDNFFLGYTVVCFLDPSLRPSRISVQNFDIRGVKPMHIRFEVGPERGRLSFTFCEALLERFFSISYIMGGACLTLKAVYHTWLVTIAWFVFGSGQNVTYGISWFNMNCSRGTITPGSRIMRLSHSVTAYRDCVVMCSGFSLAVEFHTPLVYAQTERAHWMWLSSLSRMSVFEELVLACCLRVRITPSKLKLKRLVTIKVEVLISECSFNIHWRKPSIRVLMNEGVQHCNLIVLFILNGDFDGGVNWSHMLWEIIHLSTLENDHCIIDVSVLKFRRRCERRQSHIFKVFYEKISENGANRWAHVFTLRVENAIMNKICGFQTYT